MKDFYNFPHDLFVEAEKPSILLYKDLRIGAKVGREIYLELPDYVDEIMSILMPLVKKKFAVPIPDMFREERYGLKTIDGYRIFFPCDYFTYKYVYLKYLIPKHLTSDADDVSTGILGYKLLTGQLTQEQVSKKVQEIWEEIS